MNRLLQQIVRPLTLLQDGIREGLLKRIAGLPADSIANAGMNCPRGKLLKHGAMRYRLRKKRVQTLFYAPYYFFH